MFYFARSAGSARTILCFLAYVLYAGGFAISSTAQNGPVAANDAATIHLTECTIDIDVLANDHHPEGQDLLIVHDQDLFDMAFAGWVEVAPDGKSLSYTLVLDDFLTNMSDSFKYRIEDPEGRSDEATVEIDVVDDVWTGSGSASYHLYLVREKSVTFYFDDFVENLWDREIQLEYISKDPQFGTVTVDSDAGTVTYTHTTSSQYMWDYEDIALIISDGTCAMTKVSIYITLDDSGVPTAVPDTVITTMNESVFFDVLENDNDPAGGLHISSYTQPQNGWLEEEFWYNYEGVDVFRFWYHPDTDFVGENSFTYTISNWDGSDTATVTIFVTGPLPVTWLSVDGAYQNGRVNLTWTTAAEKDNAGFRVQTLREDAFETVGFVPGAGQSSVPQSYEFNVPVDRFGKHIFRLKQENLDGSFSYSPEVSVHTELAEAYRVSAPYPNPSNSGAGFEITVSTPQFVRVEVYDMLGRRVGVLLAAEMDANETVQLAFDGSQLPSGIYLISVRGLNFVERKQITLLK